MGKKVLIVDTDMRKPKLHKYTGLHNSVGLSNLIVDDLGLDKVIQPSNQENLFVITSGSKVPNPTRIFSSQKMQALMQKLKQDFDFIIYDTAPLMGFSDAKIITPMTDGIVFVIGLGQAHRPNVKRVIDDLKVSNLPVLGVVANGAKKNTESYYNYYNYKKYYQESVM